MVEEVAALSDKVSVEVYDFMEDKALADSLGIDKVPAVAVVGAKDYGIRMFGIPSGYEFGSLIESIKLVSAANRAWRRTRRKWLPSSPNRSKSRSSSHPPDRTARQPCCWHTNWPWRAI